MVNQSYRYAKTRKKWYHEKNTKMVHDSVDCRNAGDIGKGRSGVG